MSESEPAHLALQARPTARNVADVRRCLLTIRTLWTQNSPECPFNLTERVRTGEDIQTFCYEFILVHHTKRMARTCTIRKKNDP